MRTVQTAATEPFVQREDRAGVAILRVNRPKSLNALNADVLEGLNQQFRDLEDAPEIHGIILTGAGDKAFIAGADIGAMAELSPQEGHAWGKRGQDLLFRIENHPKTVIAAVNGYALGGGLEIAMACDWIVAVPEAKLGQPEVTIGVIPGFAGTQRLARLVGKATAKYLCMTGESVSGEEAARIGLVTKIVPREQLLDECLRQLSKVQSAAPVAVRLAKDVINRGVNMPLEAAADLELAAFALTFSTRDQKEGMKAFLEKRKPRFTGQ